MSANPGSESAGLAARLADFLHILPTDTDPTLLEDELRFPAGGTETLQGSQRGAALWATAEGRALLAAVSDDPAVRSEAGHNWDAAKDGRMVLAGAAGEWLVSGEDPAAFAGRIEADLWDSLRRTDIWAGAITLVEGIVVPPPAMRLNNRWSVLAPTDENLAWAFEPEWPGYRVHLPTRPYSLFVTRVVVQRTLYGAIGASALGRVEAYPLREMVWLASGALVKLGSGVMREEHWFPVFAPDLFPMENANAGSSQPVDLSLHRADLAAILPRFGASLGFVHLDPPLDPGTRSLLDVVHAQASAVITSPDPILALLLAFAAADGSLLDGHDPARGTARLIPPRFGLLCGRDDAEAERLQAALSGLDFIRDRIAHGSRPSNGTIGRFIDDPASQPLGDSAEPWFPPPWDPSGHAARAKAAELLRRLYRAWLLATLEATVDGVRPGLTRAEVVGLLRDAVKGDEAAKQELRKRTTVSPESEDTQPAPAGGQASDS